jgi:hypothetical protein
VPGGYPVPNDSGALVALIVGIASIVLNCLCGPAALVAGAVALFVGLSARRRIRASAGTAGGDGMALAGVITGGIGGGLGVLFTLFLIAYIILVAAGIVSGNLPIPTPTP